MNTPSVSNASRPFGAHLSMSWWKPLVVIVVPPIAMIILQLVLFQVVAVVDQGGERAETLSPLQMLAANISIVITGILSVPLVAWMARVPWRTIISHPRSFDRRRLGVYLIWALGVTLLGNASLGIFLPEATPWVGFHVSGTTIALLAVIVLTTPMQAAAEELMFRGAVMPAVASWVRPERLALALGVVVSSIVFAATHFASDLWLFGYHVFLGLATATMAIRSKGLEAPIAFHIANNTLSASINTLLAGGGDFGVERTTGAGGPHLLLPTVFITALTAVIWIRESRATKENP